VKFIVDLIKRPERVAITQWRDILNVRENAKGWVPSFNSLSPSDAVWKQKKIFQGIILVQYCKNFKNITPLETRNLIIQTFLKA